jgi:hypothetical protein
MSIERAIHDRWRGDPALASLLPAARLFTGTAPGTPATPYAVLARLDTQPVLRTSSGTALDEVRLEISIWSAELELLQQIVAGVERRFERAGFPTRDGTVLNMRRVARDERREAGGYWRATLTFLVLHETQCEVLGQ